MKKSGISCSLLALICTIAPASRADTTLDYTVQEPHAATPRSQSVLIKNGQVMIKGAGGEARLDVLYGRDQQKVWVIDHHERTVMTLDEKRLDRLARQAKDVQPLIQGLGAQLGKLSPDQRHKWEQMLGGKVDLERLAESAASVPTQLRVLSTGESRKVAGISCQSMNVVEDKATRAEFCLAQASQLNIPSEDYATLRALLGFSERLVAKARALAGQLGVKIPAIAIGQLEGVPIEMQDLSRDRLGTLTLSRVMTSAVPEEWMQSPAGYRSKELKFLE